MWRGRLDEREKLAPWGRGVGATHNKWAVQRGLEGWHSCTSNRKKGRENLLS